MFIRTYFVDRDETLEPVMAPPPPLTVHGRGASANPANRFEALALEPDLEDLADEDRPKLATKYYRDFTRTIIAHNDSPDVGFDSSVNPVSRLRAWLHLLLRAADA